MLQKMADSIQNRVIATGAANTPVTPTANSEAVSASGSQSENSSNATAKSAHGSAKMKEPVALEGFTITETKMSE